MSDCKKHVFTVRFFVRISKNSDGDFKTLFFVSPILPQNTNRPLCRTDIISSSFGIYDELTVIFPFTNISFCIKSCCDSLRDIL